MDDQVDEVIAPDRRTAQMPVEGKREIEHRTAFDCDTLTVRREKGGGPPADRRVVHRGERIVEEKWDAKAVRIYPHSRHRERCGRQ